MSGRRTIDPKTASRRGERRRWKRLPLALPVFIRSLDIPTASPPEFTSTVNISAGGMLVRAERPWLLHTSVEVEIAVALPMELAVAEGIRARKVKVVRDLTASRCRLLALRFVPPLA